MPEVGWLTADGETAVERTAGVDDGMDSDAELIADLQAYMTTLDERIRVETTRADVLAELVQQRARAEGQE